MAKEQFEERLDFFRLARLPDHLYWINKQPKFQLVSELEAAAGVWRAGLHVTTTEKSDFWQKTFYAPLLVKTDAPALLMKVPNGLKEWTAELHFSLENATHQFDQAGLMVYATEERWMKAGIEMVDGSPRMSCVVTNGSSDWSVRPWRSATDVAVRVSHVRGSLAVECRGTKDEEETWSFYRIAPSMVADFEGDVGVGLVCCSPADPGMTAIFHSLSTSNHVTFDHHSS